MNKKRSVRRGLNEYISRYYPKLLNTCRQRIRWLGIPDISEDILQNALLEICSQPVEFLKNLLNDEDSGDAHLFNLIRIKVIRRTIDATKAYRAAYSVDERFDECSNWSSDASPWEQMTDEDYARFRNVSSNVRQDNFMDVLETHVYVPPKEGWVSGYVHAYTHPSRGQRYAYWQYAAYIGSRCKGDCPKRLKVSASRHEAYMALMKYNRDKYY